MDWGDQATRVVNVHGSKARVGSNGKSPYSDWRRTVGHGCFANDIDWIEWRVTNTGLAIVALVETTFYEDKPDLRPCLPKYCAAALARFKRDGQYVIAITVAERLEVPAYFVIARDDLAVFFVCRLADEAWREMDEARYRRWLMTLGCERGV